jgi:anaerobic magnesium-protoporphyrin IX monomethyl ester cyclase
MKVIFVYPDILEGAAWRGYYYSGIGVLSSVLKCAGHQASLLHITQPITQEEFLERLARLLPEDGPLVIGFSVTSNMAPYLAQWSEWIKSAWPKAWIIAGGVHPTLEPERTLDLENIDGICMGEGEGAILELAEALQANRLPIGIANLWWKRSGTIVERNPMRPLVNLDMLPFPDRAIYNYADLYHEQLGEATMMISRGCPYSCTYCCNEALRGVYRGLGQPVRFRRVELVIEELRRVLQAYPFVRRFAFDDDILPLRREWFHRFAQDYAREIGLPFACNLRPNLVDETIIALLKNAGCDEVRMGVESGNDEIRNGLLNRQLSREKIIRAFELCHQAGMKVYSFNIVGFPGETIHQMLDTVKLNMTVRADTTRVTIFYPYSGTRLHQISQDGGLLTDRLVSDYAADTLLKFDAIQRNRVIFVRRYFSLLVRLYRWTDKLPALQHILDAALSAGWVARTFFWVANKLYELMRKNTILEHWITLFWKKSFGQDQKQLNGEWDALSNSLLPATPALKPITLSSVNVSGKLKHNNDGEYQK